MQPNQLFLIPVLSRWCPLFLTASLHIKRDNLSEDIARSSKCLEKKKNTSPYIYLKYFPPHPQLLLIPPPISLFSPLVYSLMATVTSPGVSDAVFLADLQTQLNFSFSALPLIPSIFMHVCSPSKCKFLTVKPGSLPFGLFCIICHCGQLHFLVSVL